MTSLDELLHLCNAGQDLVHLQLLLAVELFLLLFHQVLDDWAKRNNLLLERYHETVHLCCYLGFTVGLRHRLAGLMVTDVEELLDHAHLFNAVPPHLVLLHRELGYEAMLRRLRHELRPLSLKPFLVLLVQETV